MDKRIKNKDTNKKHLNEMQCIYEQISKCFKDVETIGKLINDNRRRRTTKFGTNQATPWEIAAVMSIREGKSVYKNNIYKKDFSTEVKPDGSIVVIEKNGKGKWFATGQEIDNYELRTEGRVSRVASPQFSQNTQQKQPVGVQGGFSKNIGAQTVLNSGAGQDALSYIQNAQQFNTQQEDSVIVKSIASLGKIVSMIAAIIATISLIKVGPAVKNLKEVNKSLVEFSNYVKKIIQRMIAIRSANKRSK